MTPISGQAIYHTINSIRIEQGVQALAADKRLVLAAQAKASDMASRGYFSHRSPDGKNMWSYVQASGGCSCSVLGENLAKRFSSVEALETAWLNSKGHADNIYWSAFNRTGIGIATAKDGTIYVVQLFSR